MGADLGGSHRALEDAGDLGKRQLLEAGEQEHFAIVVREAGEGVLQERLIVASGGPLAGVRLVVGVLLQIGGIDGVRGGVAAAEMIRGAAPGQMVHPGGEAAIVAIGVAVLEHPLKDDLGDILGRGAIAGELCEKAEQRAVVALEEFAERIEFAIADGEHERMVGALVGSEVHGSGRPFNHGRGGMNTDFFEMGNHGGSGTWWVVAGKNRPGAKWLHGFCGAARLPPPGAATPPGRLGENRGAGLQPRRAPRPHSARTSRSNPTLPALRSRPPIFLPPGTQLAGGRPPTMNRRDFLLRSTLFASAGLLARSRLAAQAPAGPSPAPASAAPRPPAAPVALPPAVPEFRELRRGVGCFTARGGTIGWLANPDALAAIDTQYPETAALFLAGLPGRSGRTLDLVINTHHHGDHTGGNPVFKPAARTIVAHASVPALQLAAAQRAEKAGGAQPWAKVDAQVYADTTFPATWRRDLGDETISARYHGPAHTGGDIVVVFEKANVVHMGDIMFNRTYPVTDRPGGCSLRGWIQALEDCAQRYPADAIYLFGHGNAKYKPADPKFGVTGQRADLLVLRDYLSAILLHVQKEIAAGKKKEEVIAMENFPGFPDFHSALPNRLGSNLGVAWDELTNSRL
jgi:cyclase